MNTIIDFQKIDNRKDFLSVDKLTAISAQGEIFTVGDLVEHDDENAGQAIIKHFELDEKSNEVKAITDNGWAHICFISKVNQEQI